MLREIELDKTTGILIVPEWPTQTWFALLKRMLLRPPLRLTWRDNLVTLPFTENVHPLRQEVETDGLLLIRRALSKTGLSNQPIDIILDSWSVSTKKQYSCYIHVTPC